LAGRKGRGRAAVQPKAQLLEPESDEPLNFEDGNDLELPASELRLGIAVLDWWEVPRWHEIWDEGSLWGDPSPEAVRIARELRRGKRMDT